MNQLYENIYKKQTFSLIYTIYPLSICMERDMYKVKGIHAHKYNTLAYIRPSPVNYLYRILENCKKLVMRIDINMITHIIRIMKTLSDVENIHLYLYKNSPKQRKRSRTLFYTTKYVEYSHKGELTEDSFIEQVSFSINGVYVEGGYYLRLYSIGGKVFDNKGSNEVFLTKEHCKESLGKDFIGIFKKKRIQHYKNLIDDKKQKIIRIENEIIECKNILTELTK